MQFKIVFLHVAGVAPKIKNQPPEQKKRRSGLDRAVWILTIVLAPIWANHFKSDLLDLDRVDPWTGRVRSRPARLQFIYTLLIWLHEAQTAMFNCSPQRNRFNLLPIYIDTWRNTIWNYSYYRKVFIFENSKFNRK